MDYLKRLPDDCSIVGELTRPAFSRVAEALESRDNTVRLLRDGTENYPRWLEAIRAARRHVHLENYILKADGAGQEFADALIDAARRGVSCRILYDWLGCLARTPRRFWQGLREAGIDVRCYNPPRLSSPLGWISRDHRKVLCVDGEIGFTGGLCIAQDWIGRPDRNVAPWRDTAIEVRGTAVAHLEQSFADSWQTAGAPLPDAELAASSARRDGTGLILGVIPGRP
ncbi:MAG TPA: phospholipase D-like domain-containing protein, partial [Stellaceae bacterium]|nr:phospholipase D-like domain-containing protein [Stellaceae bacterium]